MKKRHLAVAVVAALALSTTIASAEGGSHRRIGEYDHISSVTPISLSNNPGVLTIDTHTTVPNFVFDTSTVTPHIDFDPSTVTAHFDTSTATSSFDDEPGLSDDGQGEDDFLPATSSTFPPSAVNPSIPPTGLTAPATPLNPNAPLTPLTPSWITKPHAKSNEDRDQSGQASQDSPE